MEQTAKDRALMKALAPKEAKHLPSNFSYLAMRRIEESHREALRRQRIAAIIVVIVLFCAGLAVLAYYFGSTLYHSLVSLRSVPDAWAIALSSLFCLTFFALLNQWLAHRNKTLKKSLHNIPIGD